MTYDEYLDLTSSVGKVLTDYGCRMYDYGVGIIQDMPDISEYLRCINDAIRDYVEVNE